MVRGTALLAVLLLVTCAPLAHGASRAQDPGILYSLDAKGAVIAERETSMRLSMPANTPVTWFADRPDRRAGTANLRTLAAIWKASGFAADPPNAALLLTHRGEERTHVVTLRAPRLIHGRVSFALRPVRAVTEAGYRGSNAVRVGRYGRARVFIDDAATPPCPAMLVAAQRAATRCLLAPGTSSAVQPGRSALSVRACSPVESGILADLGIGDAPATTVMPCSTTAASAGPSAVDPAPVATLFSNQTPSVAPVRLTNVSDGAVAAITVTPMTVR